MPHLRTTLIKHSIMAASLALGTGTLSACASTPESPPTADFSGNWHVKWCDRTNPKLDCGGFDISVVQEGNRLCGDFGGALVNLRQIDDGTLIGSCRHHRRTSSTEQPEWCHSPHPRRTTGRRTQVGRSRPDTQGR